MSVSKDRREEEHELSKKCQSRRTVVRKTLIMQKCQVSKDRRKETHELSKKCQSQRTVVRKNMN